VIFESFSVYDDLGGSGFFLLWFRLWVLFTLLSFIQ